MKKNRKLIIIACFCFLLVFLSFGALDAYAKDPNQIVPESENGDYTLNDFLRVAITISKWVLMLSGSLALLAFIVGGLMLILSGGNSGMVEKGKNSLVGAAIGLVIVFTAFTFVDYLLDKINYNEAEFNKGSWDKVK